MNAVRKSATAAAMVTSQRARARVTLSIGANYRSRIGVATRKGIVGGARPDDHTGPSKRGSGDPAMAGPPLQSTNRSRRAAARFKKAEDDAESFSRYGRGGVPGIASHGPVAGRGASG